MKEVANGTRPIMMTYLRDELHEALRGMTQEQINDVWDSMVPKLKEAKEGELKRREALLITKKEAEHYVWDNLGKIPDNLDWWAKELASQITEKIVNKEEYIITPRLDEDRAFYYMWKYKLKGIKDRQKLIGVEGYTGY